MSPDLPDLAPYSLEYQGRAYWLSKSGEFIYKYDPSKKYITFNIVLEDEDEANSSKISKESCCDECCYACAECPKSTSDCMYSYFISDGKGGNWMGKFHKAWVIPNFICWPLIQV